MFDPEIILIGGGISKQEERLLSLIEPFIDDYLPTDYGHAKIEVTSKEMIQRYMVLFHVYKIIVNL